MAGTLIRSLRWLIGYQMARLLVGFFLGSWVARILGPSEFGLLTTAAAMGSIAYCFVELGMRQLLLREVGRRKHSGALIAGTVFRLWLGLGAVATLLLALWNLAFQTLPWGVLLATSLPLLLTALSVHNNWEEGENRSYVAARNAMWGYLGAAVARVLCIVCAPNALAIAWTFALESVLAGLLGMRTGVLRRRGIWPTGWSRSLAKCLLSRGCVLFLGQAGALLLLRVDVIMIDQLCGKHEAGLYGAALRLSELAYFVSPMLVTILLPRLSQLLRRRDEEDFRRLAMMGAGLMAMASFASVLVLMLVGSHGIRLLFGSSYENAIPILFVHCVAVIPYFQMEWRHAVLVATDLTRLTAWFCWAATGLNLLLNLMWIPRYGAVGAAWATLVSYTVCGLASTWLVKDLRWLARAQLFSLALPFDMLLRPKNHLAQWREVALRTNASVGGKMA